MRQSSHLFKLVICSFFVLNFSGYAWGAASFEEDAFHQLFEGQLTRDEQGINFEEAAASLDGLDIDLEDREINPDSVEDLAQIDLFVKKLVEFCNKNPHFSSNGEFVNQSDKIHQLAKNGGRRSDIEPSFLEFICMLKAMEDTFKVNRFIQYTAIIQSALSHKPVGIVEFEDKDLFKLEKHKTFARCFLAAVKRKFPQIVIEEINFFSGSTSTVTYVYHVKERVRARLLLRLKANHGRTFGPNKNIQIGLLLGYKLDQIRTYVENKVEDFDFDRAVDEVKDQINSDVTTIGDWDFETDKILVADFESP